MAFDISVSLTPVTINTSCTFTAEQIFKMFRIALRTGNQRIKDLLLEVLFPDIVTDLFLDDVARAQAVVDWLTFLRDNDSAINANATVKVEGVQPA